MKRLSLFISFFVLSGVTSFSQFVPINEPDYNKPKLFQGLPAMFPVNLPNLNSLFDMQPGEHVSLNLSDVSSFQFEGVIVSNTDKYGNKIRSVVIRSSNYNGAGLTISKITTENGEVIFRGRILSLGYGDVYDLQNLNGSYILVKKGLYDLVNE